MSQELYDRILAAKEPNGWGEEADSSFARHLIILGLKEVEQIKVDKSSRGTAYQKKEA